MPPNNPMTVWGNEKTMNLNTLVLTNIQSSPYFKVNLFELKTYHEVIDEIYYKVRGVGAGGIVSSAYCLLYKLYTLKLTKKQVIGLINHQDSPYIRGLGFMYIRYTQPPADLWPWFEDYLDDEEEIDVKAGGGHVMTIGDMLRQWLVKLEWYSTLFPRIPVPIEKDLAVKLKSRPVIYSQPEPEPEHIADDQVSFGEAERRRGYQDNNQGSNYRRDDYRRDNNGDNYRGRESYQENGNRDNDYSRGRDHRGRDEDYSRGGRGSPAPRRSSPTQRYRHSSPQQRSSASRRTPPRNDYPNSFERELARERERQQREKDRRKSRSRSPRKERRSHSPRDKKDRRSRSPHERREKRSRSPHDKRDKRSRSPRDRKDRRSRSPRDKKERRSRSRDRKDRDYEHHGSASHKRSHKDKKDKHRDKDGERREEKSHKHKNRDKDRR